MNSNVLRFSRNSSPQSRFAACARREMLSAYELKRQETVAKNQARLVELGLVDAKEALAAAVRPVAQARPRKPKQPKEPVQSIQRPKRASRSATAAGHALDERALDELLAPAAEEEEPPTKKRRTFEWWDPAAKYIALTAEQRARIVMSDDWIEQFEQFWEDEGDSESNRRSVMKVVHVLASGTGVYSKQRTDSSPDDPSSWFAPGVRVNMHTDLEALQQQAFSYLPMKSAPTWMRLATGVRAHYDTLGLPTTATAAEIEAGFKAAKRKKGAKAAELDAAYAVLSHADRKHAYDYKPVGKSYRPPPNVPLDKSNGWALNHPIGKLQYFQRALFAMQNSPQRVAEEAEAEAE